MAVKPVPDTYHTLTPYLVVKGAAQLVDFLKRAFGAREAHLMKMPNGDVAHGDLVIGDSHVMLGEANGPWSPHPSSIYVYLADCDATFKQVYAVVAHSGVVIAVQQLFTLPLDYVRETLSSPTNLAVFLPFLDENSFPARLLGSIDLFVIWWSINLAIGLGVLYRKRTGPIATTLLVIYVTIGLVIAAVKTALAGT